MRVTLIAMLAGILLAAGPALADGSATGTVLLLQPHNPDVVIFNVGTHGNKPACSSVGDQWALSLSSSAGRAMYALLLAASMQGQTVHVQGTGLCDAWPDRESPRWLVVNP